MLLVVFPLDPVCVPVLVEGVGCRMGMCSWGEDPIDEGDGGDGVVDEVVF